MMEHIAPLIQSVLWVTLISVVLWKFYLPLYGLLNALKERIEQGSSVKAGPFEINDYLKPQDVSEQKEKTQEEIKAALPVATAIEKLPGPLKIAEPSANITATYFQAEDLALRAIQAEYGVPVQRQVVAGNDVGVDGAFVISGQITFVEVKYIPGVLGNLEKLKPSVDKILKLIKSNGWRNARILLAVIFQRPEELEKGTNRLNEYAAMSFAPIVIRTYSIEELRKRFGIV